MENRQEKQSVGEIVNIVFKAVAVGMSVAAIVLGVLGTATTCDADYAAGDWAVLSGGRVAEIDEK